MAYYGVTDDRRRTTTRQVAILQAVAQQIATEGRVPHPETASRTPRGARQVRPWADDAECLRSLARWQFEEPEARPGRVALIEFPRPVVPLGSDAPIRVFPPAGPEDYEARGCGSPGFASSEGPPWVLARAAGFLVVSLRRTTSSPGSQALRLLNTNDTSSQHLSHPRPGASEQAGDLGIGTVLGHSTVEHGPEDRCRARAMRLAARRPEGSRQQRTLSGYRQGMR